MKRILLTFFLASAIWSPNAYAVTEIPCNGVDDDGNGGDAGGPAGDVDCDGYCASGYTGCPLTGTDADDTNTVLGRKTYPGAYLACGTDGTRIVNSDGTYGSCVEGELCEKTGSGVCYYIDPLNGNNSNAGTSRATAWQTPHRVNYHYDGTSCPTSNCVTPAAGSVIYFMGTADHTTIHTGSNGICKFFCSRGYGGSASHPIRVKGYPLAGNDIVWVKTNSTTSLPVFRAFQSSYWIYQDLGVDGLGTDYGAGFKADSSSNISVYNITVKNRTGNKNDNDSGVQLQSNTGTVHFENSNISDTIAAQVGAGDNNFFIERGTLTEVIANRIWNTAESGDDATQPWKAKHTNSTSQVRMEWNIWANGGEDDGFGSAGGDWFRATNERYYNVKFGKFADWGGPSFPGEITITKSSFYKMTGGAWLKNNPTRGWEITDGSSGLKNICTGGNFTIEQFTATDNAVSFSSGTGVVLEFWKFGPDYFWDNVIVPGLVRLDNNLYEGTISYDIASASDGNPACTTGGERGVVGKGATYANLAAAEAGGLIDESDSVNEAITWFDAVNLVTDIPGVGFQPPVAEGGPDPTPTPTASPSPTPTGSPTPTPSPTATPQGPTVRRKGQMSGGVK